MRNDSVEAWLLHYQKELLLLANHTIGKKLLQIENDWPIFKVTPESYHQIKPDGNCEAVFYTSDFVADKLLDYLATPRPKSANFIQKLHYAYLTTTFNPATGERMGRTTARGSWASARGSATSDGDTAVCEVSSQLNGGTYYNYRLHQPFNCASLNGVNVLSANWQGYRDDVQEIGSNGFLNADTTSLEVVVSSEADPTAYGSSDYANVAFVSRGSVNFASVGANNTYTSAGAGIGLDTSIINVTGGYTKLAIITGRDLNNAAPTGLNCINFQNRSQANPPKLVVTYNPIGTSPSASVSPSASNSPSSSVSPSVSPSSSKSPSSSQSPSASKSPSSSISHSVSPSSSVSASTSPSPSVGYSSYSRGNYVSLPTNANDLETLYTPDEETQVITRNDIGIGQAASGQYAVHQFKILIGTTPFVQVEWEGHSDLAPMDAPVYLQIYNTSTNLWETVDSNSVADENVDFELEKKLRDLTNYKDGNSILTARVYQLSI